ncbi:hypothetical protein SFC65_19310 [Priestia filamentosa]|uniref:hypothetical protein n=1 Tax=Priestia filamentosa TaxID=1402861 RepID=UPI003981CF44
MNDFEKTQSLFKTLGVGYKERRSENQLTLELFVDNDSPKVSGYIGFCTEFIFDIKGDFLEVILSE